MPLIKIYKKSRQIAKTMVKRATQSHFATLLNCHIQIPNNYSFILLGSHGVGYHSLLYYLSLCKDKQGKNIYPMPLHMFSKTFDLYGHLTSLRFYKEMYPIISKKTIGAWGLTFDAGIPREQKWVKNNLIKKVPAVMLVRDPILTLTTTFNYEIFCNIHSQISINYDELYLYILKYFKSSCGFVQNLKYMQDCVEQICYIDCTDLTGDRTYPTIQRIADFLHFTVSFHESFKHSINSPIQRYFTNPIIYNNQELYLSSFPHFFRITSYPHYFSPNYCDDLGYTHQQPYSSSLFPDQELYLFSKDQIEITKDLREKIEEYLSKFKNILEEYNKQKITPSDFIDLVIKHGDLRKIQKALEEEVSVVPKEMVQKWEDYLHFMQIKG